MHRKYFTFRASATPRYTSTSLRNRGWDRVQPSGGGLEVGARAHDSDSEPEGDDPALAGGEVEAAARNSNCPRVLRFSTARRHGVYRSSINTSNLRGEGRFRDTAEAGPSVRLPKKQGGRHRRAS